nr:immunoglobulin heavy chain junction region [Homo sapiens]MBN4497622.1 immunoglobulin heavy chain junction region [Homo sapiens]MBN4581976.1 immunoglobulin heavy chain junction region [Homo sapiens]
SVKGRFTISR